MEKVAPLFIKKGLDFKVEYLQSVRDWEGTLPKISNLHGAYRRRTIRDQDIVPHSFTFIRRESLSPVLIFGFNLRAQVCLQACWKEVSNGSRPGTAGPPAMSLCL